MAGEQKDFFSRAKEPMIQKRQLHKYLKMAKQRERLTTEDDLKILNSF